MPIDTDELEPVKKRIEPLNLDALSIAELEAYIAQLNGEISTRDEALALVDRFKTQDNTLP